MSERPYDAEEYGWLRELRDTRGEELRRRYGAHTVGVGWKHAGGQEIDRLALVFYVERKQPSAELAGEPIPPSITFTPANQPEPVTVATDVVETPTEEYE